MQRTEVRAWDRPIKLRLQGPDRRDPELLGQIYWGFDVQQAAGLTCACLNTAGGCTPSDTEGGRSACVLPAATSTNQQRQDFHLQGPLFWRPAIGTISHVLSSHAFYKEQESVGKGFGIQGKRLIR